MILQVAVISAGEDSPPAVGLVIDGKLFETFSSAEAQAMAAAFARAAESLDQLVAAGPPYPVSNYRN